METFGVFDGGEGGDGAQRGQFVQQTTNRSSAVAVRSDQPRGPRPASVRVFSVFFQVSQKKRFIVE